MHMYRFIATSKLLIRIAGMALAGLLLLIPGITFSSSETYYRDQVAVIAYHHLSDTYRSSVTIPPSRFSDQLRFLREIGYHFISLGQFRSFMAGGSVPDNAVLVTFDDGYESFYKKAYPILRQWKVPAVNFVITGEIDTVTDLPSLTSKEMRTVSRQSSSISFACHTDSLHRLQPNGSSLLSGRLSVNGLMESDNAYIARVVQDTRLCLDKLAPYNRKPVDSFAYPYGKYNAITIKALRQAGIRFAFTTHPGIVTRSTDPLQLPRINAGSPYVQFDSVANLIVRQLGKR